MNVGSILKFLLIAGVAVEPVVEGVGMFGRLEGGISLLVATSKSKQESRVAIVRIDRADFIRLFDSKLPLPAEPLTKLIDAVGHSGAACIGLDLDTSDPSYKDLAPETNGPRLIWGQPAEYSHIKEGFFLRGRPRGGADPTIVSGLSIVLADRDGAVRRYRPAYRKAPDTDSAAVTAAQFLQSFPARVAGAPDSTDTSDILIDFRTRDREVWSASDLLAASPAKLRGALQGKIVLIGMTADARDEHQTPLGWKNGVDILADAVDTELKVLAGGRFRAPSRWTTLLLAILIAAASRLLLWRKAAIWYYALASALLVGATVLAGLLAYGSVVSCLYFLPAVVAVSADFLVKKSKERKRRHSTAVRDHATKAGRVHAS